MTALRTLANNNSDKSANDSQEVLFDKRALLYDEISLHEACKAPTKSVQGANLAAAVDGGKGDVGTNNTPIQGLHVSSSICDGFTFAFSK